MMRQRSFCSESLQHTLNKKQQNTFNISKRCGQSALVRAVQASRGPCNLLIQTAPDTPRGGQKRSQHTVICQLNGIRLALPRIYVLMSSCTLPIFPLFSLSLSLSLSLSVCVAYFHKHTHIHTHTTHIGSRCHHAPARTLVCPALPFCGSGGSLTSLASSSSNAQSCGACLASSSCRSSRRGSR
jgi:hypothetical protein